LALAKSFTELQGGRLSIQSTVGAGTTVVVDFPTAKADESAPAQ
jgi:signal transduction histidine kinase